MEHEYLLKAIEKIEEVKVKYEVETKKVEYIERIIRMIESYLVEGKLKHNEKLEKHILSIVDHLEDNIDHAEKLTKELHEDIEKEIHKD